MAMKITLECRRIKNKISEVKRAILKEGKDGVRVLTIS